MAMIEIPTLRALSVAANKKDHTMSFERMSIETSGGVCQMDKRLAQLSAVPARDWVGRGYRSGANARRIHLESV